MQLGAGVEQGAKALSVSEVSGIKEHEVVVDIERPREIAVPRTRIVTGLVGPNRHIVQFGVGVPPGRRVRRGSPVKCKLLMLLAGR